MKICNTQYRCSVHTRM